MEKQKNYFMYLNIFESNEQKLNLESNSGSIEEKNNSGIYVNEWHQEYELIYQSYTIDAG